MSFFNKIILLSLLTFSCSKRDSSNAKISFHSTGEKNSFIFTISEEFLNNNSQKFYVCNLES